jgi:NO-binding membrane sensor protein with MHYT domain
LLVCGIVSSLLYVTTDVLGGLRYDGYRFMSQAVSELEAIGAPSRAFVVPLFLSYGVLIAAFGLGVWKAANGKRSVRATGGLLIGIGVVGLVATPFAPMHMRGAAGTLTDAMHIILTSVTVVCILLAIGFAGSAFGRGFRVYSIATIAVLVVCGALAGMNGARLAAQQPTPWLGLTERINIYGYLLWVAVLSTVVLRRRSSVTAARD